MLILVAVTVSYTVKSGLIGKTLKSREKYEEETIKEIVGASIVYKITATTIKNTEYIDIPRTSVEIYKNLTANGFKIPEGEIEENVEDKNANILGTGVKIVKDTIDLTVVGEYGKYNGKIETTGITKEITKVEENKSTSESNEFLKFGSTYIDKEKTVTYTFVKENNNIYIYEVYFKQANFTNNDCSDKREVTQINLDENMDDIEDYLDFHSDDFTLTIDNVAPIAFTITDTMDSEDIEEREYFFFSKDYSKIIESDDSSDDMTIGEFDYQSYFSE